MKKGKFIVLDGGEGVGKDTQIALLKQTYGHRDDIVWTREPGGTKLGGHIRSIVQDKTLTIDPEVDILLYKADRMQHMREIVIPSLEVGMHVISNRSYLSTIAYELYGLAQHEQRDLFEILNARALSGYTPDCYIVLDLDPREGISRKHRQGEGDTRFERQERAFHERVRQGFLEHVPDEPMGVVIDAGRPIAAVAKEIAHVVESHLG